MQGGDTGDDGDVAHQDPANKDSAKIALLTPTYLGVFDAAFC